MKKIFSVLAMLFVAITISAQKDVTKFLGIPVDGFKPAMKQKLIAKGFTPKKVGNDEFLEGEFNGKDVELYIVTNNNKVYRIMVAEKNSTDEANIKIRYNNLVNQFENNKRYVCFEDQRIPEDEDISYSRLVDKKTYDAIFYQKPDESKIDTTAYQEEIQNRLLEKYTIEQLKEPNEEIQEYCKNVASEMAVELISKKAVWFRINESYGKYYLTLYYDNEYNRANGEDL